MNDTESDNQEQLDIDAEADKLEEEMQLEIEDAEEGDFSYLLPWLIPAVIVAAFILIIVFVTLRK